MQFFDHPANAEPDYFLVTVTSLISSFQVFELIHHDWNQQSVIRHPERRVLLTVRRLQMDKGYAAAIRSPFVIILSNDSTV